VGLVFATAVRLIERARRGEGPAFLLCHTYRFHGHHVGDISRDYYRSKAEEETWRQKDPLKVLSHWLIEQNLSQATILQRIEEEVRAEVEAAVDFALNAPYPQQSEVTRHVYA
jgi:acetoin:2,6-dichlorophenolindophenol oxidoreductase subunit alpha